MFHNVLKEMALVGVLPPVADLGAAIVPATYIDMTQFDRAIFILYTGVTNRTTATIQVLQATSSAGAGSKALATNLVSTAVPAAGNFVAVEFGAKSLDLANGFRFVAVQPAVAGGTAGLSAVFFLGFRARNLSVTPDANLVQYLVGQ